jgi:hypothetical protein
MESRPITIPDLQEVVSLKRSRKRKTNIDAIIKKNKEIQERKERKEREHKQRIEQARANGLLRSNGFINGIGVSNNEWNARKNLILNSKVDLTKIGWVSKVTKLLDYLNEL